MKALILVGGFGTRLRPLTLTTPKPLVPFANKPMLERQIEALTAAGITTVVLGVNYQPDVMAVQAKEFEERYNVNIQFSVESTPLGTAGPIGLAKDRLRDAEPFIVMNSDIICQFPLRDIIEYHKKKQGICTIATVTVENPESYGVIVTDDNNKIEKFIEKPKIFVSNKINAGIYVLDQKILDMIEPRYTSIELDVFPDLAKNHGVYSYDLEGFWMDVGKPIDYLKGTALYLQYLAQKPIQKHGGSSWLSNEVEPNTEQLITGSNIEGNVLIHPSAEIGKNCSIGPDVVIGPNAKIGDGVALSNTVVFGGSHINSFSFIKLSIIGWNCNVGKWAHLDRMTVLGGDVTLEPGLYIAGGIILPNKSVSMDILSPTIIM